MNLMGKNIAQLSLMILLSILIRPSAAEEAELRQVPEFSDNLHSEEIQNQRSLLLEQTSPGGTYKIRLFSLPRRIIQGATNIPMLCLNGYQNHECKLEVYRDDALIYYGRTFWPFRWLNDSILFMEQVMGECGWSDHQIHALDLTGAHPEPEPFWSVQVQVPCPAYLEEGESTNTKTVTTICLEKECYSFVSDPETKTLDLRSVPEHGEPGKKVQDLEFGSDINPIFHPGYILAEINGERFQLKQSGLHRLKPGE
ncbi:MAG: hypothetical protein CMF59_12900 [Leptospiraceae bacterium]|nr:hypothetical protein [Leptospiraceae bacterium]